VSNKSLNSRPDVLVQLCFCFEGSLLYKHHNRAFYKDMDKKNKHGPAHTQPWGTPEEKKQCFSWKCCSWFRSSPLASFHPSSHLPNIRVKKKPRNTRVKNSLSSRLTHYPFKKDNRCSLAAFPSFLFYEKECRKKERSLNYALKLPYTGPALPYLKFRDIRSRSIDYSQDKRASNTKHLSTIEFSLYKRLSMIPL
jgi:hypothetical protein